jgi:hypothetical protein
VLPGRLAHLSLAVHPTPASYYALHVLGGTGTAHRQQTLLCLRSRHSRQLADLGIGQFSAGESLREPWQRAERARYPDVLPRGAGREADTPGEPGGTGAEAVVPPSPRIEFTDEIE